MGAWAPDLSPGLSLSPGPGLALSPSLGLSPGLALSPRPSQGDDAIDEDDKPDLTVPAKYDPGLIVSRCGPYKSVRVLRPSMSRGLDV